MGNIPLNHLDYLNQFLFQEDSKQKEFDLFSKTFSLISPITATSEFFLVKA